MKYLVLLMFILGGFLHQAESQTVLDYNDYVKGLELSGDPFQISEAIRIRNYTNNLYPTTYLSNSGVNVVGDTKKSKKLVTNVENLHITGYDDGTVEDVEMIIILVRSAELIPTGQISVELRSKLPNLKNVVFISEFDASPNQFLSILPTNSDGFVALHKVSLTQ